MMKNIIVKIIKQLYKLKGLGLSFYFFKAFYLKKIKNKKIIIIKHATPGKLFKHWGDFHLANHLAKEFNKKEGYFAITHCKNQWHYLETLLADYVIVIRGLSQYTPSKRNKNILWLISHPEQIAVEEYQKYDFIAIASDKYSNCLYSNYNLNTKYISQFTTPSVFFPKKEHKYTIDILFIGNSKGQYREVVQYCIEANLNISVYGMGWEKFIDKKYIKKQKVENSDLYKYYSNAKIILNDHFPEMRAKGFISNRIFDSTACGGFLISDYMPEIEKIYKENVVTYSDKADFLRKIDFYLENSSERIKKSNEAKKITLNNFSVEKTVQQFIELFNYEKE